jgi:cell division septation protein DedD
MTPNPAPATIPKAIPAAPVTTQEFGIVVGTFLDRARAQSEIARIGGASGLTGRLAGMRREGTTMYVVIIGAFPDRATADRKAGELVSRGTVDEARIISRSVSARP